jgi:hypothetical protein
MELVSWLEETVDLHSTQGQINGSNFIQAKLCSLQEHNLKLSKLVDVVTDGEPLMTGSKMPQCLSSLHGFCL